MSIYVEHVWLFLTVKISYFSRLKTNRKTGTSHTSDAFFPVAKVFFFFTNIKSFKKNDSLEVHTI